MVLSGRGVLGAAGKQFAAGRRCVFVAPSKVLLKKTVDIGCAVAASRATRAAIRFSNLQAAIVGETDREAQANKMVCIQRNGSCYEGRWR